MPLCGAQAAMRWRRLVELSARQRAVVDRAVRMHQLRVVTGMRRAAFMTWYNAALAARMARQAAGAAFVHAFELMRLGKTFDAWRRYDQR